MAKGSKQVRLGSILGMIDKRIEILTLLGKRLPEDNTITAICETLKEIKTEIEERYK
jgi:hypothetical protein